MGSAAQLAQALGLHRRTQRAMDPVTKERRNRLFWVCHVMANNISMLVGRPSPIQDYDCDVDLPLDVDDDQITPQGIIPSTGRRPFNFFLNDIKLSKIMSKVYCRLYSAHALTNHTWDSLAVSIGELDSELIQWRDSIPLEYRPEQEIAWADNPTYRRVMLTHMSYYNCIYNIHRPIFTLALRSGSSFAPDKPVRELRNARVYGSAAVCVGAARSGLRLVLDVGERLPGLIATRNWYSLLASQLTQAPHILPLLKYHRPLRQHKRQPHSTIRKKRPRTNHRRPPLLPKTLQLLRSRSQTHRHHRRFRTNRLRNGSARLS